MEFAYVQHDNTGLDWCEIFHIAFGSGLLRPFNIEWLIDKAEQGEWGGLWW